MNGRVLQTRFFDRTKPHSPDNTGNCLQAAVASLLDLPLDQVPDFIGDDIAGGPNWWVAYLDFAEAHGYTVMVGGPAAWVPGQPYIAVGKSPRDINHACVYLDGELLHDPHPDGTGITTVETIEVFARTAIVHRCPEGGAAKTPCCGL